MMRVLMIAALLVLHGCAANTETTSDQQPKSQSNTTTGQEAATQGSYIVTHNHFYNDNDPNGTLNNDAVSALTAGSGAGVLSGVTTAGANGSTGMKNSRAGHNQIVHFTQTITTGGTTPSQTGEATGSAAATGTTTQSATTDQTIKAVVEAALALGLNARTGPLQSALEGQGGTINLTEAEQRAMLMQALRDDPKLLELVQEMIAQNNLREVEGGGDGGGGN